MAEITIPLAAAAASARAVSIELNKIESDTRVGQLTAAELWAIGYAASRAMLEAWPGMARSSYDDFEFIHLPLREPTEKTDDKA